MAARSTPVEVRAHVTSWGDLPQSDRIRMQAARERLARCVCEAIVSQIEKDAKDEQSAGNPA